jgi:hypothetical protein
MANVVSVLVYGNNGSALAASQTMGFPTQNIIVRPAPAGQTLLGVAQLSVIQLLPTGTKVGADHYSRKYLIINEL